MFRLVFQMSCLQPLSGHYHVHQLPTHRSGMIQSHAVTAAACMNFRHDRLIASTGESNIWKGSMTVNRTEGRVAQADLIRIIHMRLPCECEIAA